MIEIKTNCLYTRDDLASMLDGSGVDVDHFIKRLGARKVFKCLWSGKDLLRALDDAPTLAERKATPLPKARNRGNRRGKGGVDADLAPLQKLMEEIG